MGRLRDDFLVGVKTLEATRNFGQKLDTKRDGQDVVKTSLFYKIVSTKLMLSVW